MPSLMPFDEPRHVGHEQIVADQLALVADQVGQDLPAFPVVFRHAVFDRDDRIVRDQIGEIFRLLLPRALLALAFVDVGAVLEEFGRRAIERQHHVAAGLVAGLVDRLHDEIERGLRRLQIRRKTALVADIGVETGRFELPLFSVWKISAPARSASANVGAPTGMIMNSWKSIGLSACTPPLTMFIIGTGSTRAAVPPT